METTLLGRPTFGGLASGLDTSALLQGLLAIERIPLQRIESRRAEISNQRSLMRDLNTKLLALREAAQEIDNRNSSGNAASTKEEFLRFSGTTSNDEVVTVSADAGASPGDIQILVNQLARGSRRFSVSFSAAAAATALTGNQTITIDLPNGDPDALPEAIDPTSITINANGTTLTLQDIRDQINTSPDNGGTVRADVLQIGDDAFQLVITSTGTGLSNELTIAGDIVIRPPVPGFDDAVDAEFELFGQAITRESNLIDDVLTGITLRLVGEAKLEEGTTTKITETVSVKIDIGEVAKGLEKFTQAYNDVLSFIDTQFRFNETTNDSGPLAGDFTLRDVQRQLRQIVSTAYKFETNPSNPFASTVDGGLGGAISGIGIEIGAGGTLSVNKEKLEEALTLDPNSVREFLSGRVRSTPANPEEIAANPAAVPDLFDEGFAQRVAAQLEQMVRSGDGTLANRDEAFARRLKEFDVSIERFERRLTLREETLIQRFSALERIIAGLQSQQGFLLGLG